MTSVIRSYGLGNRLPDPASFVVCSYLDASDNNLPFPWRCSKQTQLLDLDFVNGFDSSTELTDDPMYFRGQSLHPTFNVRGLGANFIAWMEDSQNADAGSVVMTERPIVCSANMMAPTHDPNSGATFTSSTPISFESSAGSAESGYLKTMIFLKPLIIRYTIAGVTQYRCFTNNFEGNT